MYKFTLEALICGYAGWTRA